MSDSPPGKTARPKWRRRLPSAPKRRNCDIYERHVLAGETQEQLAAERVGRIAARVARPMTSGEAEPPTGPALASDELSRGDGSGEPDPASGFSPQNLSD
jgi:hypothetical protein